jgi:hypothetical protein
MMENEFQMSMMGELTFFLGIQASPHSSPRTAVQRIFRYVKHTPEFGICYYTSSSLDLVGFSDADFVDCGID